MAQLQTHSLPDLVGIDKEPNTTAGIVEPGRPVHHKLDPHSFGLVLSRRWIWDDKPMQCEVLWSKEPHVVDVDMVPIKAQSRKLAARWSTEQSEDINAYAGMSKLSPRRPMYEVEEEYEHLDYSEVQRLHTEGADIQLHVDGRVTVKRKTDEQPDPREFDDRRIVHSRVSIGRY